MAMLKSRPRDRGFSLVELVITISILSVGLLVIFQALSASTKVTRFSNDLTRAVFLGQDLLGELEFRQEQHLLRTSDFSDSGEKDIFSWSLQGAPVPDLDSLLSIDLKIVWKTLSKDRELELKTLGYYEKP